MFMMMMIIIIRHIYFFNIHSSSLQSTVTHSKETNIIVKMTMFCDEDKTNTFQFPNEWMKRKKIIKITHKYVPWQCFYSLINVTFSCPCAHHDDIRERGGTTPHIINPVPLHNVPSDNILATNLSMLTFLLINNISLAIIWNRRLFPSLQILVSLFLWVTDFWPNPPTQPGTNWDFGTAWMCVVSLTLHLLHPWE
jgi:hypothetical protein